MRLVVADASALVELLLGTPEAAAVASVVRDSGVDLHVPGLCDVEVPAALRRLALQEEVREERLEEALRDYVDLPLSRHPELPLVGRIFGLRDNFSAYDATYVALAEALGAELLSADGRLRRAVKTHTEVRLA